MRPLLLLLLLLASTARAAAPRYGALGDELVSTVRANFYDPGAAESWARAHAGYAREAKGADDFTRLTRAALAELHTSHTAYYPSDSVEHPQLRAIFGAALKGPWRSPPRAVSVGIDVVELPEGLIVRHVFAASPARAAGLLRGDRLLEADGRPFHPVRSFAGKAGKDVKLTVERERGAPPLQLTVRPRSVDPKAEWLQAQEKGSEVVQVAGKRIAYQPLFSCAGTEHQDLLEATLQGAFKDADALVLDFRDGWGGCNPDFVNLFNPLLPVLRFSGRDGRANSWSPGWKRPVVLLVNGNARSGKELVAFSLQRHHAATLVGERTAGAVMAGRAFALSDGSLLYLAVQDGQVDGVRLEGRGVPVDVAVEAALPWAAGKDPQRERALHVAAEQAGGS
ncbi:PDZ domain-containing protein [Aggregicoccus sp. 17bor-14]|uniref:S41 family peptidase n=1 Tax=Myxococcaceae TaxID=31 RepID=UPI00129CAF6F|nr:MULTISPECIES: S41 family peptidase [Myxococcaceae]MBF5046247.1 PDZ domain-containing protein [Simulacricoccus sp. 17bor-14]MRI91970.1 PDZ domain-containing protein [Aggregicoccus sp. 17bor-14]